MAAVLVNSFNTTIENSEGDAPVNEQFTTFLVNLSVLICVLMALSVCYCATCYLTVSCERRLDARKEAARLEYIKSNLIVHEWTGLENNEHSTRNLSMGIEAPVDEKGQGQPTTKDGDEPMVTEKSSPTSCQKDDDSSVCSTVSLGSNVDGCCICLVQFEKGQRVCESNNPSCSHVFHEKCMLTWLKKHRRCPVCRQPYLVQSA